MPLMPQSAKATGPDAALPVGLGDGDGVAAGAGEGVDEGAGAGAAVGDDAGAGTGAGATDVALPAALGDSVPKLLVDAGLASSVPPQALSVATIASRLTATPRSIQRLFCLFMRAA
jgi:hypothetical protein